MKHLNHIIATTLIAISFCLAVGCKSKPNDEKILANVNEQLTENQAYAGVNATVKDGVVTLAGSCEGEDCALQVEKKVGDVDGVKKVENNIGKNDATDLTLRTSVQSIISKYDGVQADVAGGIIVLRGTIKRDQVQPLMNELEALQPKKLDNQLAVQ